MKIIKLYFSGLPSWIAAFGLLVLGLLKALGQSGATTYKADNYADPMPSFPGAGVALIREFLYTITAAFVINDVVKLCRIPAGVVVYGYFIDVPDLDSSTGIRLALGDNTTANLYITGEATVGVGAGKLTPGSQGVAAAIPKSYSAANDFALKVTTAATGTAATTGVFRGHMSYFYNGVPTPV